MDANNAKPKRGRGRPIKKEKVEEKENKRTNKSDKIQVLFNNGSF